MDKRSDAIIEKYAAPFVQIVLEKISKEMYLEN